MQFSHFLQVLQFQHKMLYDYICVFLQELDAHSFQVFRNAHENDCGIYDYLGGDRDDDRAHACSDHHAHGCFDHVFRVYDRDCDRDRSFLMNAKERSS
mmetsp:Transcript_23216/g.25463  ORF Transcript_23216/g.25463 Transcript_23216/m.25463 type:complete len:98 (-) Transcript_23216:3-296(-)